MMAASIPMPRKRTSSALMSLYACFRLVLAVDPNVAMAFSISPVCLMMDLLAFSSPFATGSSSVPTLPNAAFVLSVMSFTALPRSVIDLLTDVRPVATPDPSTSNRSVVSRSSDMGSIFFVHCGKGFGLNQPNVVKQPVVFLIG